MLLQLKVPKYIFVTVSVYFLFINWSCFY